MVGKRNLLRQGAKADTQICCGETGLECGLLCTRYNPRCFFRSVCLHDVFGDVKIEGAPPETDFVAQREHRMVDTEQGRLWRGEFGDAYLERNAPEETQLRNRTKMWANVLNCMLGDPPKSILEIGSNIGLNLRVLPTLLDAELFAVEPNDKARSKLIEEGIIPEANLRGGLAMDVDFPDAAFDMAFTCTVLIHIHPDDLLQACREVYRVSSKYIVCIEYFSDKLETVHYRGQDNALFKRDFGGFWMDNFPDLALVDYGFFWKRVTGLDNFTWWVFKKG